MSKLRVISVGSGKGGVGKTTIAYSLALLFSYGNKRVLIIDFDLYTQGLSHFFQAEIFGNKNILGLLDVIYDKKYTQYKKLKKIDMEERLLKRLILKTNDEKIDVISVSKDFFSKVDNIRDDDIYIITSLLEKVIEYVKNNRIYDYIIIDNHAGISKTLECSLRLTDDFLIVSESDDLSQSISLDFQKNYSDMLPKRNTFLITNKVFTKDAEQYANLVKYLDFVRTLPPLPLDYSVIRAFILRNPILDIKKPSAFLFAIFNIAQRLFPSEEVIENLNRKISVNILKPVVQKSNELQREVDLINNKIERERSDYRNMVHNYDGIFLIIFSGIFGIFSGIFTSRISRGIDIDIFLITLLLVTLLGVISIYFAIRTKVTIKAYDIRQEIEAIEKDLIKKRFELEQELDSYKNILIFGELIKKNDEIDK